MYLRLIPMSKKIKQNKTILLNIRLSKEELEQLKKIAEIKTNGNVSKFIRNCIEQNKVMYVY